MTEAQAYAAARSAAKRTGRPAFVVYVESSGYGSRQSSKRNNIALDKRSLERAGFEVVDTVQPPSPKIDLTAYAMQPCQCACCRQLQERTGK